MKRGAALVAVLLSCSKTPEEPPRTAPPPPPSEAVGFDRVFVERAAEVGLVFTHDAGTTGRKFLPETMGASPVVFDCDGDGALDVLFADGGGFAPGATRAPTAGSRLFRNRGDGSFEDATARLGGAVAGIYAFGGAAADYDGDGDEDLYVTALGDNVLLRNDGGAFVDATATAGVAGGRWRDAAGGDHPEWSTAAAWFDADGDGDLDLFVANYVAWSPEIEQFTTLDGVTKAFSTPDRYPGLPCRLFLNRGDGTFEDATEAAGLAPFLGKALGVALFDADGDGKTDVIVANDTRPNFLFRNLGGGRFEERGLPLGVAYDENGRARAGMGVDAVDEAGDGGASIAIGNFSAEPMSLWRRRNDGGFEPAAAAAGLAAATTGSLTFGLLFFDADLDGTLDIALANGHIEPEIARTFPSQTYAQPPQLFRGLGNGRYADVSLLAGADFARPRVGRGLAAADFDGDGDLDVVLTSNGVVPSKGVAAYFENRPQDGAPRPNWLRVRVRGRSPNTSGLGAKITVKAGGRTQTRLIRTGSSYAGQSDVFPTFGLGTESKIDELRIRFPLGVERTVAVDGINRTLVVDE